jgi:phosphatidylserine decarboxylase
MRNQNTPFAIEGLPIAAVFCGASLFLYLLSGGKYSPIFTLLSLVALFIGLFALFFFRNPQRTVPSDENAVIAPADGTVIFLGETTEEHLNEEMIKISIFMSIFDVHINRVPITGKLTDNFYIKGSFLDVRNEKATFENERNGIVIETSSGTRIVVVQVAGLVARRIVCYPQVGEMILKGERYGLIRFGSRLDVFLPRGADIRVKTGDRTVGGETILGILP